MKKILKMTGKWISLFAISFLCLWILFGAIRLHTLNAELRERIEYCEESAAKINQEIQNLNPTTIEEYEELNWEKAKYITYVYHKCICEKILEKDSSIPWSFIDVYARQRVLWLSYFPLSFAEFFIELHEDYFVPSATSEKREKMAEMIEKKREKTHCFLEVHPPQGLFNKRSYSNIEPLIPVLEKICRDFEAEDDLLYRAYQAEAALYLSDLVKGFSHMKWYELPHYGAFPREGVVTFRYIWMDISIMIAISFFVATFSVWWRYS